MGRTEQALRRLREQLADQAPEEFERERVLDELRAIADAVPKADAKLGPVVRQFTEAAGAALEPERALSLCRALVDAALQYAAHRDHPQRASLLEAVEALVAVLPPEETAAEQPTAPGGGALPPTFVGDLPPESTVDDAALLLIQLEPEDRYGIGSLIEILERLAADADRSERDRARLREGAQALSRGASAEVFERVGAILESIGSDDAEEGPDAAGPAAGTAAAAPPSDDVPEPEPAAPAEPADEAIP